MDHHTFLLQDRARETARSLPGVTEGYPFTDTLQVFKVAGRVFLIVTEDPDQPFITVKAEPADVQELVAEHDSVQPGRYLNKRHWITATPGPDITLDLVQALVQDSYDLVVESLPARDRPTGRPLPT